MTFDLKKILAQTPEKRLIAAFDADGTIWNTDVGDGFFEFEVSQGFCGLNQSHKDQYRHLHETNHDAGFLYLAAIHKGLPEREIQEAAEAYRNSWKNFPYIREVTDLIKSFQEHGIEIFVVSASIKWAVAPFLKKLNIPYDHLIGVETEVIDGIITDRAVNPLPYKEGKISALLNKTRGVNPLFAFGNTIGDFHLLKNANHPVVVNAHNHEKSKGLLLSEEKLIHEAVTNNWTTLKI